MRKKGSKMPARIRRWFIWQKLHGDDGETYYDLLCCKDYKPMLKSYGIFPSQGKVTFVDIPRPTTRRAGR